MSGFLENAIRKVSERSEDEQNVIASQILETTSDEQAWEELLRGNAAKVRSLAAKALDEHHAGGCC